MTKRLAVLLAAVLLAALAPAATLAAVNSVTPSTNAANKANGWAYASVTVDPGMATLTFHSTRPFLSCFEWRTDGDTSQKVGASNYNPEVTDGLYPYTCVNNSVQVRVVHPAAYVEVRMVFGAERDERFDWTRFDVPSVCTATGFVRDGIDLTAAVVDPAAPVTGEVDATGCNIGVYFSPGSDGVVDGAEVFGANYYGVLVNAAHVNIVDAEIHDIGESPFNGAQHGIGVMYTTINHPGEVTGPEATGLLADSRITDYQKGGVVITGDGAAVRVRGNTIKGLGKVDFIAQNGVQVSYGATARVQQNRVVGNWYTPKAWVACGLLYYGADGVRASQNHFRTNEKNVCNVGRGGGRFMPAKR